MELQEEQSPFLQALRPLVNYLVEVLPPEFPEVKREPGVWKFAIPMEDGRSAPKFAQARQVALVTVKDQAIRDKQVFDAPAEEPGRIPAWLESLGVTHVIASDLSGGAKALLQKRGIEIVLGAPQEEPERLVEEHLKIMAFDPTKA
jgi:predicted Fe-Mo cluster-binding NifX family protein